MNLENLPADELVRSCLESSSSHAWNEFVRRYNPVISWEVSKKLRGWRSARPEDGDELVQQVYLHLCDNDFRVLRRLLTVPPGKITAYLRVVTANLVTDYFRKQSSVSAGGGKVLLPLDGIEKVSRENPESQVLFSQVDRHLARCSKSDLARDRRVFWLYYRSGLSANEIARVTCLKLEVKGVESLLHRLADCVRQIIAEGDSRPTPSLKKGKSIG